MLAEIFYKNKKIKMNILDVIVSLKRINSRQVIQMKE